MTTYPSRKLAVESTQFDPDCDVANKTVEVSSYVRDMIGGLRGLTRRSTQKDLAVLDHLLAMAEEEASKLATHVYH